jgi:beta-N-acetylglucosaminidase
MTIGGTFFMKKIAKSMLFVYIINLLLSVDIAFAIGSLPSLSTRSNCNNGEYEVVMIRNDKTITNIGCYTTYSAARTIMNNQDSTETNVASIIHYGTSKQIIDARYGLLDLKTKANSTLVTNLRPSLEPSVANNYINGYYGVDAALIDYVEYRSGQYNYNTAKLKISGYMGWIRKTDSHGNAYNAVPLSLVTNPTYYYVNTSSELIHRLSKSIIYNEGYMSAINLGPAPNYLEKNKIYYSYDGNYFYLSLSVMLDDYKSDHYNRAINKNSPYYNYYLYLPHRTRTSYTIEDIDNFIQNNKGYTSKPTPNTTLEPNQSMLYGEGINFISAQNRFGANSLLVFGVAVNESGWGRSNIAINRNNLFGHAAYDYDPGTNATSYATVGSSINSHADRYVSASYSRPGGNNYYGSHLGNKGSGMNVRYASDPYWGEKAAQIHYAIDKVFGMGDYHLYQMGIKNTNPGTAFLTVRKEATTNSGEIYVMRGPSSGIADMPVVILDIVEGQVINNNNIWYKIQTDAVLDANRNALISVPDGHTYDWDNNYGYVHSSFIRLVDGSGLIINANPRTILQGSNFDPWVGVTALDAKDGNITQNIQIIKNDVNAMVPAEYEVVYRVVNSAGREYIKSTIITVRSNALPVISSSDIEILQNYPFDPLQNVTAFDNEDGNITSNLKVINGVNTATTGVYHVKYSVTDSDNNYVEKTINVTVIQNVSPIINAVDKLINQGQQINLLDGVTAFDDDLNNITDLIETIGNVNINIPGVYPVTYNVIDGKGNRTNKTITVTVRGQYQEVNGNFYLHSFNWRNNKVDVSGYLTITGIHNIFSNNIVYEFILHNVDNGELYSLPLDRWEGVPYPFAIPSENGFSYSDSWFRGTIDLSIIPEGDYVANIKARMNGRETTAVFRNMFFRNITRKAVDTNGRGYLFRTNYYLKTMPLEIFVRDSDLIANIEPPTQFDNMFNAYKRLELINNNNRALLDIRGFSFNVMGDYGLNQNVNRQIVFENIKTYERISKNLGYVDNANVGINRITLRVPDGKDKTRAWFDNQINLDDLSIGRYSIYIRTKAGSIDDFGELNDITFRNFAKSITVNNKVYTITTNNQKRGRIELVVSAM